MSSLLFTADEITTGNKLMIAVGSSLRWARDGGGIALPSTGIQMWKDDANRLGITLSGYRELQVIEYSVEVADYAYGDAFEPDWVDTFEIARERTLVRAFKAAFLHLATQQIDAAIEAELVAS